MKILFIFFSISPFLNTKLENTSKKQREIHFIKKLSSGNQQ